MFRIFVERTYLLIFCLSAGWLTTYLLSSKPLEGKAQIIATNASCPLIDFWMSAYESKECYINTDIKLTEIDALFDGNFVQHFVQQKATNIKASGDFENKNCQQNCLNLSVNESNKVDATTLNKENQHNNKNYWLDNPYKAKKDFVVAPPKSAFIKAKIRFKYRKEIEHAHKVTGVPKNLIAAIICQESGWGRGHLGPKAKSPMGAKGLMQLMPYTAKRFGCTDVFNPQQNILAGAKYLAYLNKFFKGDKTKVIAAYNSGEGNVLKYNGIPPFAETQDYVPKVIRHEYELAMLGD